MDNSVLAQWVVAELDRQMRYLQQMNDRLMTLEKTVNTFLYEQPTLKPPPDRIFEPPGYQMSLSTPSEDQLAAQFRGQRQKNVKTATDGDGNTIFRIQVRPQEWIKVVTKPNGGFVNAEVHHEREEGGIELTWEDVRPYIADLPIFLIQQQAENDDDQNSP
jgi:hypothetical protein